MNDYVNGKAGAREDLCRFLAACYYEPTTDFGEERLFESIAAAASAIDSDLAADAHRLGAAFVAHDIETLLVDYTRLFIGPSQPMAMPYASFWLTDDQSMRHEATARVLDLYEQGGFDISDDFRELPDHVAAELEFLYLLIYRQNQAQLAGNAEELLAARTLHQRFVGDHLNAWFSPFASAITSGAQTTFYQELAGLTKHFLIIEAEIIRAA